METRRSHGGATLHFSRWSRKGYAMFASLGREVRVGHLALRICAMSLKKAARKGLVIVSAVGAWQAGRAAEAGRPDGRENAPDGRTGEWRGAVACGERTVCAPCGDYVVKYVTHVHDGGDVDLVVLPLYFYN